MKTTHTNILTLIFLILITISCAGTQEPIESNSEFNQTSPATSIVAHDSDVNGNTEVTSHDDLYSHDEAYVEMHVATKDIENSLPGQSTKFGNSGPGSGEATGSGDHTATLTKTSYAWLAIDSEGNVVAKAELVKETTKKSIHRFVIPVRKNNNHKIEKVDKVFFQYSYIAEADSEIINISNTSKLLVLADAEKLLAGMDFSRLLPSDEPRVITLDVYTGAPKEGATEIVRVSNYVESNHFKPATITQDSVEPTNMRSGVLNFGFQFVINQMSIDSSNPFVSRWQVQLYNEALRLFDQSFSDLDVNVPSGSISNLSGFTKNSTVIGKAHGQLNQCLDLLEMQFTNSYHMLSSTAQYSVDELDQSCN